MTGETEKVVRKDEKVVRVCLFEANGGSRGAGNIWKNSCAALSRNGGMTWRPCMFREYN
jgi:hypothetical protein